MVDTLLEVVVQRLANGGHVEFVDTLYRYAGLSLRKILVLSNGGYAITNWVIDNDTGLIDVAFWHAASNNQLITVVCLELRGARNYNFAAYGAAHNGNIAVLEWLWTRPVTDWIEVIKTACASHQYPAIQYMLDRGIKIRYVVDAAVNDRSIPLLTWLEDQPEYDRNYALAVAAREGYLPLLGWFQELGVTDPKEAITIAIFRQQVAVLEWFDQHMQVDWGDLVEAMIDVGFSMQLKKCIDAGSGILREALASVSTC